MEKKNFIFLPSILFLFITTSFLLNQRLNLEKQPVPVELFGEKTDSVLFAIDLQPGLKADSNSRLFLSDCLGDLDPELILQVENSLLVYDLTGQILCQNELKDSMGVLIMTADMDGDGKKDLIFSSETAHRNKLTIMNGIGHPIALFQEDSADNDFSSIIPALIKEKHLYALARPADVESPRGLLIFDLPTMKLLTKFYTPDPIDISWATERKESIILSYQTHHDGVFLHYGKESDAGLWRDFGVRAMLLTISPDGRPLKEVEVFDFEDRPSGILDYSPIPGSSDKIFLVHHDAEIKVSRILEEIFILNSQTGEVIVQKTIDFKYIDHLVVDNKSGDASIVLLFEGADGILFSILNEQLKETRSIPVSPDFKLYHPSSGEESNNCYGYDNSRVYKLNEKSELEVLISTDQLRNLHISEYESTTLVTILNENQLSLYGIAPD